jgi:hypothetical protein
MIEIPADQLGQQLVMRAEVLNQPCQKIVVGVIQHTGLRLIQRRVVAPEGVAPVSAHELEQTGHHFCGIAGEILKKDDA